MAETLIKRGDAVELVEMLEAIQDKDASQQQYWFAQIPYHRDKKAKPPYVLFDSAVGVYVGTKYVPLRSGKRGIIQTLKHAFFFNDREIFIDPRFVKIIARVDDSIPTD